MQTWVGSCPPPGWPIKKLNDHIFMTDEGFLVQYPFSNQLLLNMA